MKNKYIVTFAGVPGSSKSIVANHLSFTYGLPVVNNDQLRHEVKEDLMVDDINIPQALGQFHQLKKLTHEQVFSTEKAVILDSSADREWGNLKKELAKYGYQWFLISFDYSTEFMTKLYTATNRLWAIEQLSHYQKQHQDFLNSYSKDININLNDQDFINRVLICNNALKAWLAKE